ncbi:MAG: response regulator transcription factor [Phycisphaerales bacterium]|jgi:FixJ family two-component response regulator
MVETALGRGDKLIGYFSQGQDCLEKLSAKPCDILIVDLEGSEGEGLDLLTQVRRMAPWVSTVAIVERAAVPAAVKAVKAGACECLEKPVSADRLGEAIEKQLVRVALLPRSHRALTQMEIQILQLILAGKTSQDIAAHLHRSKRTIDVHRKNIMRKLQAASLVDLIKRALGMGLIDDAESDGSAEPDEVARPDDDETSSRS